MDELAAVAHVLRRTTFGPFPGRVEALAGHGVSGVMDLVLAAPALELATPVFDEDAEAAVDGPAGRWLRAMADPAAGLHEKLVWFWHAHFTSSHDKVDTWELMWRQHLLLRRHALGNFRELAQAVTVDGAMLQWLDGAGSVADAPNENHGRELMELFTLGRGNYTQADVKAAATALSGWTVEDNGTVSFDPEAGNRRPVQLLGRSVTTARDAVDVLCDRPECARFIAAKLHHFLVGQWASEQRVGELAAVFTQARLEIRPLVEAILHDESFAAAVYTRPRYPVEWVTAAFAVCGIDDAAAAFETMTGLGQSPFYPPNVAGWPPGNRWLAPGTAVARAAAAIQAPVLEEIVGASDPVAAVFARAAIYDPTPETSTAARDLAFELRREPRQAASALLALAITAPEFTLA
ncbi:DUF1800 domain-containing protein [Nocardia sp. CDC160]|uniref:DUF1800 domain-containing protein n=1 Tax=Nocardia sp. CDC160 TaxID=3112166 RepID=UPI002DB7A7BD|nr:DUF1800 family protein [Nocardia sp. CDC160]MEC3919998.1 DUF1800 family protein [Nocardia sp. CDC160]